MMSPEHMESRRDIVDTVLEFSCRNRLVRAEAEDPFAEKAGIEAVAQGECDEDDDGQDGGVQWLSLRGNRFAGRTVPHGLAD